MYDRIVGTLTLACLHALLFVEACPAGDAYRLLFESGRDGYRRYRIPSLVVTKSGTLIAVCEGRVDGGGLTGNVDLVCRRSTDNGRTWSDLELVADLGKDTVGNQSVLIDRKTEAVWIAHTVSPGEHSEKAITRGKTKVSTRVFVTHFFIAMNNDASRVPNPMDLFVVVEKDR